MSNKMNVIVNIQAYDDEKNSIAPTRNNVKWNREVQGIDIYEPESKSLKLNAGESLSLFSGSVPTFDDATTTWDIALKENCANSYKLSHNSGTLPVFRQARISAADATTEVTITKNSTLLTFTSTGGTLFDLIVGGAIVGDKVRIEKSFNVNNQGVFTILSLDATSFTIENASGQAEGPITLGAEFAEAINIYSKDGVQEGDKIEISAGFSSISFGSYNISEVSHNYVVLYSNKTLPEETGISNVVDAFEIYRDARQFLYMESDTELSIYLNGSATPNSIIPFNIGSMKKPGIFMTQALLKECVIENKTLTAASIFFVSAE